MFTIENKIRYSEVDTKKAITLPAIINYFQDCSIFQSEEIGLGFAYLEAEKRAWILSSWQIVVEKYPLLAQNIKVGTWATGFEGLYGTRNFIMLDDAGNRLAYANSIWVLVDMETGRPVKPRESDVAGYELLPAIEMEYSSRKIKRSHVYQTGEVFSVRKYHIDTNAHVNNCQYVQMALEVLPEDMVMKQTRVEYRQSAVYGDRILPKIAVEKERIVVELCNMEEKPYAVIEFIGEK